MANPEHVTILKQGSEAWNKWREQNPEVRQGLGKTDRKGEEPAECPISPADLFATLVLAMGAKPDHVLRTNDGRPVQLVEVGAEPVREALRG